jgi:hypothetical protein
MKHTSHFLITPREYLGDKFNDVTDNSLSDLLDPILWSGSEVDKGELTTTDYEHLVKVLFVDTLVRERSPDNGFAEIFGTLEASEKSFDLFWNLKRVDLDWSVDDALEDAVVSGSISTIHSNNPRVKAVLESMYKK